MLRRLRFYQESLPRGSRWIPGTVFGSPGRRLLQRIRQYRTSDGRIEIDNNISENHLRRVAIGRKNWLFVGSERGGERLATILSVVASAHRYHLDLWSYLKDVLERLASGTGDLESLLPDVWKRSRPDKVREFRAEGQRRIAERKRYRRAGHSHACREVARFR